MHFWMLRHRIAEVIRRVADIVDGRSNVNRAYEMSCIDCNFYGEPYDCSDESFDFAVSKL